jgi:hypothetical protein
MNDFLITVLAEDHRRELLAEARAEALAHEALAARRSWWYRLFHQTTEAPSQPAGTTVNNHMAAGLISAR